MLALGLDDGRVMLADEETGRVKWAVHAGSGNICRIKVAVSPLGTFVASVCPHKAHWILWNAESGKEHKVGAPFPTEKGRASARSEEVTYRGLGQFLQNAR